MCLDTQDKKIKKHTIGYKLCRKDGNGFRGEVFNTGPYLIGKTYDSKEKNNPLPKVGGPKGVNYKAGFHYFRKLKDAKEQCGHTSAVIRIKVKNILATGTQNGYDAGVAEFMTLDRVAVDGAELKAQREEAERKKFLAMCEGKVESKILEFAKQFELKTVLMKARDMKKMADFMTKTIDNFVDAVVFIDIVPRKSKLFKMFTKIHTWAFNNHDEYKNFYYAVAKDAGEVYKKLNRDKDYNVMVHHAQNIDSLILEKI